MWRPRPEPADLEQLLRGWLEGPLPCLGCWGLCSQNGSRGRGAVLNEEQAPWWPVLVSEEVRRQADRLS